MQACRRCTGACALPPPSSPRAGRPGSGAGAPRLPSRCSSSRRSGRPRSAGARREGGRPHGRGGEGAAVGRAGRGKRGAACGARGGSQTNGLHMADQSVWTRAHRHPPNIVPACTYTRTSTCALVHTNTHIHEGTYKQPHTRTQTHTDAPTASSTTRRAASGGRAGAPTAATLWAGARWQTHPTAQTRPAARSRAACKRWRSLGPDARFRPHSQQGGRQSQVTERSAGMAEAAAAPSASVLSGTCLAAVEGRQQVGLHEVAAPAPVDDGSAPRQPAEQRGVDYAWASGGGLEVCVLGDLRGQQQAMWSTPLLRPTAKLWAPASTRQAPRRPPVVDGVSGSRHTSTLQPDTNSRRAPSPW
jgi:hypothetical protein